MALRIYDLKKPVIAAINGPAVGFGVTMTLPMDIRIASSAARIGFDWPSAGPIFEKIEEELAELRAEIGGVPGGEKERRQFEEFGDLMFVIVNLGVDLLYFALDPRLRGPATAHAR